MKSKMLIENYIPLLKELLGKWKQEIGGDFTGFKNHIYRMIPYCFALQEQDAAQWEKVTITECFHDIGIWTDATSTTWHRRSNGQRNI